MAAIAPVLIAIASFVLRIFNLGSPKGLVFDEVYYVDGARDYWHMAWKLMVQIQNSLFTHLSVNG